MEVHSSLPGSKSLWVKKEKAFLDRQDFNTILILGGRDMEIIYERKFGLVCTDIGQSDDKVNSLFESVCYRKNETGIS